MTAEQSDPRTNVTWEQFRQLPRLVNHWRRPTGPRSYYWFLTFEHNIELHSVSRRYQQAISLPYYDLVPIRGLHLTLDRIAFEGEADAQLLNSVQQAATQYCRELPPLHLLIQSLSGTPGAIGFEVAPNDTVRKVRDHLRAATLSVHPSAPVRNSAFHAHVALAYSNSDDVPTAEVVRAVESLGSLDPVAITVRHASLVVLERRTRSYEWRTMSSIPFSG